MNRPSTFTFGVKGPTPQSSEMWPRTAADMNAS